MSTLYDAVLFDFDYTLADSSSGVVDCVNYALSALHLPAADPQSIYKTIGYSLRDTFMKLVGDPDEELSGKFAEYFVQRADMVMADKTILFDYVPQMFRRMKKKGLRLGIVSTKYRYRIEDILRREKLLPDIDAIIGGEDVELQKPDPEGLVSAIRKLQSIPGNVLYVGDSLVDSETAKRCKVKFAAVLSGSTTRDEFAAHSVVDVFEDLPQLTDWIIG